MRIPFITHWLIHRDMRDTALTMLVQSNVQLHEDLEKLRLQMGARDPKREVLLIAAMELVDKFDDPNLAHGVAPHLSELELAPLTGLMHAAGRHDAAEFWERYQVAGDDSEPEDDQDNAAASV
ncbi:hypothetical protein [Streptomyces graminilatus]|uniref:hypothetical protein n=1 Tax=Streptomyces graminilatus TaxID=1464070 RepID=UPI0006E3DA36|nr:hypothetical protein [Streptomyces graminilatus]